jgi:hypothetical protein
MTNIFQGNDLIIKTIAKTLGYSEEQEYSSFTEDIYFQAFFYLSKRFGEPSRFDDYKEAGAWRFKVKNYIIDVRLNSLWVEFIVYGKIGNHELNSPYIVKAIREKRKKEKLLLNEYGKWNETETIIVRNLFSEFLLENKIDESMEQDVFDKEYSMKWFEYVCSYNIKILDVDFDEIVKKYGHSYQNSYTRHALKTLSQFINNLLTPIWIRDVPYNLKGQIKDKDLHLYERYQDNIKIEFQS